MTAHLGLPRSRILEVLTPEKRRLSRASAPALTLAQFYLFYFSGYSTSILLFFRSTESHEKPFCFYPTQVRDEWRHI